MKKGLIAILAAAAILFTGCQNPKSRDAHLILPEDEVAVPEGEVFLVPDASEVDYVENMAATRQAYRQSLQGLVDYYESVGNATKLSWAKAELKTLDQTIQYRYLQPAEWMPVNRQAMNSIEEADQLYEEAMKLYRQAGGLLIVTNQAKLRQSLGLFNDLIKKYPSSDKADDAAYRAARIYEHLKNYELAAIYYQRTFQWNEVTPYPARFRAARIMDTKLKMRKEALALYRLSVEKESRYAENTETAQRRIAALTKPEPAPELEVVEEEVVPVQEEEQVEPVEQQ